MENKADLPVADIRQFIVCQCGYILSMEPIFSTGGHIQASQHIHQRGLTASGMSDDGHKFLFVDGQAHMIQCPHLIFPRIVNLAHIFDLY